MGIKKNIYFKMYILTINIRAQNKWLIVVT